MPPPPNTSEAAGVIVLRDDRVLMVLQQRASGMRWEIPSGGREPGETLSECAAREVKEETGLLVEVHELLCCYTSHRLHRNSVMLGAVYRGLAVDPAGALLPQHDDGIVEAQFIDPFRPPSHELGQLTAVMLERWWPHRCATVRPFHVELWRTIDGYVTQPPSFSGSETYVSDPQ